ncbi:MAG: nuclear transport factor 2 family protein [Pseudomonadota bacterium]
MRSMTVLVAFTMAFIAPALADEMKLPDLKTQPSPQAVVDEHLDALNKCDWDRLMAQYPDDVQFMLPNGVWIDGRVEIGKVFAGFCTPREDGGFLGATFITEESYPVGDTINVSWRVEAEWLTEPYKGADAYVTKDGLMQAQVTTFNPADMKFK